MSCEEAMVYKVLELVFYFFRSCNRLDAMDLGYKAMYTLLIDTYMCIIMKKKWPLVCIKGIWEKFMADHC